MERGKGSLGDREGGLAGPAVAQVGNPCGLRVCSLRLTQGLYLQCPTLTRGLVRRGGSQQIQEWKKGQLTFCAWQDCLLQGLILPDAVGSEALASFCEFLSIFRQMPILGYLSCFGTLSSWVDLFFRPVPTPVSLGG